MDKCEMCGQAACEECGGCGCIGNECSCVTGTDFDSDDDEFSLDEEM